MFVTPWENSEFGLRAEELEVVHVYEDYDSFDIFVFTFIN